MALLGSFDIAYLVLEKTPLCSDTEAYHVRQCEWLSCKNLK